MNSAFFSRIACCMLIFVPVVCFTQSVFTNRLEAAIDAGVFIYQGDLTPRAIGSYATLRPRVGVSVAYFLNRSLAAAANIGFGSLAGSDGRYANPEYRRQRNFAFSTPVNEFSVTLVWDILRKNGREGRRGLAPYLFAGAGLTVLNIRRDWSRYNDEYFIGENLSVRLAEEVAERPPAFLPVFPVGGGLKYFINDKIAVKAETNYRIMFSDRLDGFSRAVNPATGDNYYSHSLGVVFSLGYKNRNDCPPVRF